MRGWVSHCPTCVTWATADVLSTGLPPLCLNGHVNLAWHSKHRVYVDGAAVQDEKAILILFCVVKSETLVTDFGRNASTSLSSTHARTRTHAFNTVPLSLSLSLSGSLDTHIHTGARVRGAACEVPSCNPWWRPV